MRYASASTAANVTSDSPSGVRVVTITCRNLRGETRSMMADRNVAIMHAVPDAENQLSVKMAGEREMDLDTAGISAVWLCSHGHEIGMVTEFSCVCIGFQPHNRTQTTSSR